MEKLILLSAIVLMLYGCKKRCYDCYTNEETFSHTTHHCSVLPYDSDTHDSIESSVKVCDDISEYQKPDTTIIEVIAIPEPFGCVNDTVFIKRIKKYHCKEQ